MIRESFEQGDQGFSFSKHLGLAILTTLTWLFSLIGLKGKVLIAFLILLVASLYTLRKNPRIYLSKDILFQEVIFLVAVVLFSLYIATKPELYPEYSEDFTDFAFVKAILRSDGLPYDPWFAGELLRYYYFGHLMSAVLITLSQVRPEIGYNLAVIFLYSMAVQSAYGLGYNMTKSRLWASVTPVIVLFSGYLSGFLQFLSYFTGKEILSYKPYNGEFLDFLLSFDFTASNWVIPNTLSFYPFYTFLQGDLHSHFVSIPFQLAFVSVCYWMYRDRVSDDGLNLIPRGKILVATVLLLFFIGLNPWNFPANLLILIFTLYLSTDRKRFITSLVIVSSVFLVSLYFGLVGLLDLDVKTKFQEFLQIFALFTFVSLSYVFTNRKGAMYRGAFLIYPLFLIFGFLTPFHLLFIVPLLISVSVLLVSERSEFSNILTFVSLLLLLFCEIFYINDPLGKPAERFNTVMKFYLEIWILWGVAVTVYLSKLRSRVIFVVVIVILLLSFLHPFATIISMPRADFMGSTEEFTLNGMKWLEEKHQDEYKAIKWLDEHVNGEAVVLEVCGNPYTYSSRVSSFTGLSTIVGWRTHEIMWGRSWDEVRKRCFDVDLMYISASKRLIEMYDVDYFFVGEIEMRTYGKLDFEKFSWLKEVYRNERVVIYKVVVDS